MMYSSHPFFAHLPNWVGFAVLIGVWMLFRNILLRWRRGAAERMRMQMGQAVGRQGRVVPLAEGQVRCPRCAAGAPGVAMYCPHCGLALGSLPPPMPVQLMQPQKRRLLMAVVLILGVIGLLAFLFWWFDDRPAMAPMPPPPNVRIHQHYR